MSSDTRIQAKPALGHCLCGNIRIKCKEMSTEVHVCHCATCRGWSGAPALSIDCGRQVTFEGSEHLRTYDSSEWADRGFCAQCGTHLFYRLKHDQRYIMPVGLFGTGHPFSLHQQIFIDEKPTFYDFANTTEMLTSAEVFAQVDPDGS